jgi:S-adenosylmethionine hydrolase
VPVSLLSGTDPLRVRDDDGMRTNPYVSFLTDYGWADGFVAACHGVMMRIAPAVRVIDITHQIPPQQVRRGAAVLAQTVPWLPPAVHLAVVDPGVGTARRAVAVRAGTPEQASFLVGPDNGLLSWAWIALGGARAAVALGSPAHRLPDVSATFHGRDVFAPAAAHLAVGVPLGELGPPIDPATLTRLPEPSCVVRPGEIDAEIVSIDGFGNVQLAATPEQLASAGLRLGDAVVVHASGSTFPAHVGRTFADVAPGDLVVLADSAGYSAVAANGGSAAAVLNVHDAQTVVVCRT